MATPTNNILSAPPVRSPFLNADGTVSYIWIQWFNSIVQIVNTP